MKYIFVTGAPGSKWSSVVKNIYFSDSIDRSDRAPERTYRSDLHLGSYFDPGMEFGKDFDRINQYSRAQCEAEFDRPFSGQGIRIIKSHVFANHIDFLRKTWPEIPVVLVQRSTDACLGWWVRCGGFDIAYPNYKPYYQTLPRMAELIDQQNHGIGQAWLAYPGTEPTNNQELAAALDIARPNGLHDYAANDIKVKLILPTAK